MIDRPNGRLIQPSSPPSTGNISSNIIYFITRAHGPPLVRNHLFVICSLKCNKQRTKRNKKKPKSREERCWITYKKKKKQCSVGEKFAINKYYACVCVMHKPAPGSCNAANCTARRVSATTHRLPLRAFVASHIINVHIHGFFGVMGW